MNSIKNTSRYLTRNRQQLYDKIIRVDHAGELGADRIYHGQMFVLRNNERYAPVIQQMWDQEKDHLKQFELYALKHRSRKSYLSPFWSVAGFVLGAGCALIGPKAAMACTVAVEKVITQHYNDQIRELINDDQAEHEELIKTLSKFRDDEQHHHDCGLEHEAEQAPGYQLLTNVIENTCKLAIKIAEKV